jgi:thiamine-monophosphate kinase
MEFSENELILRFRGFERKNDRVLRGIGDDCAVVTMDEGAYVFTQDSVVEHIHFEFSYSDARSVGRKSLYVNISDILSMGAEPLYFLITIGFPGTTDYRTIRDIYRGIASAAEEFGVTMLGGDTTQTRADIFIDISMVGRLAGKKYLGRNGAQAGDLVGVTGYLGESAYGLELLKEGRKGKGTARFIERFRAPRPPLEAWRELLRHDIPNAMMDISDGLIIDLERMMRESRKGAKIFLERLPVPDAIIRGGKESLALAGGEDYQLLFTFPESKAPSIEEMQRGHMPVSVIGKIVPGKKVTAYRHGKRVPILRKGYEHFEKDR